MKNLTHKLEGFAKANINYVKSDFYGFALSQSYTYLTTLVLNEFDVRNELNVAITLGVKTGLFFLGKYCSTKKHERKRITRSIIVGKSIASLGPFWHWYFLTCGVIPKYLAYPLGYFSFGILGTGVRWGMDFKSRVIKNTFKKD